MDEPYLLATARYIELNSVPAKLVADAAEWPWSSAKAHLAGHNDRLANVAPMLAMVYAGEASWTARSAKKNCGICATTAARASRWATPTSSTDWNISSVAFSARKARPEAKITQTAIIGIASGIGQALHA